MGDNEFAQTWRKPHACERCRKFKVRCQYASPGDSQCIRCSKAGSACVIKGGDANPPVTAEPPPRQRPRPPQLSSQPQPLSDLADEILGPKPTVPETPTPLMASYSHLSLCNDCLLRESQPVTSEHGRVERIQTLRLRIYEAQQELALLDSLDFAHVNLADIGTKQLKHRQMRVKQSSAKPYARIVASWMAPAVESSTLLSTALSLSLYTPEEMDHYLKIAVNDLRHIIPYPSTGLDDLETLKWERPIVALALVTVGSVHSTLEKASDRLGYFEKALGELIHITYEVSMNLITATLIYHIMLTPDSSQPAVSRILIGANMVTMLDLCNSNDVSVLNDPTRSPEEVRIALERARCYMWVMVCLAIASVNRPSLQLLSMPNIDWLRAARALEMRGVHYDRATLYAIRIITFYTPNVAKLRGYYDSLESFLIDFESSMAALSEYRENIKSCFPYMERHYVLMYKALYYTITQCFHECLMCRLVISASSEPRFNELFQKYAEEIKQHATLMIDVFVELQTLTTLFPVFVYYRPLFALTSLIRLRLLAWAMRMKLDVEIEPKFAMVKQVWLELTKRSHAASVMYSLLLKVEKWMNIKMGRVPPPPSLANSGLDGEQRANIIQSSSVETVYRIIRDIAIDSGSRKRKRDGAAEPARGSTQRDISLIVRPAGTSYPVANMSTFSMLPMLTPDPFRGSSPMPFGDCSDVILPPLEGGSSSPASKTNTPARNGGSQGPPGDSQVPSPGQAALDALALPMPGLSEQRKFDGNLGPMFPVTDDEFPSFASRFYVDDNYNNSSQDVADLVRELFDAISPNL